jgi:PBP1b-binding outer membrane lipoprotein LpoB
MRKLISVLLVTVMLSGCAARGPYHAAVVIEHDTKTIVQAFQQAEMVEFNAGRISVAEHQALESGIEKVALAGQTVTLALQQGAAQTTALGDVSVLTQAVSDLNTNGVLSVKNAQAQAVLTTALNAIKALLANLQTEVGAAQITTGAKP